MRAAAQGCAPDLPQLGAAVSQKASLRDASGRPGDRPQAPAVINEGRDLLGLALRRRSLDQTRIAPYRRMTNSSPNADASYAESP